MTSICLPTFTTSVKSQIPLVQRKNGRPVNGLYLTQPVSEMGEVCCRCLDSLSLDEGAYWLFTVLTRVCLPLQACLAC